ncbi:NmrA/HSCARG family protein [Nocardia sp. NPDC004068]|uniref:NmrA/HSCARG family protein n=1 Tax=Nocardia sp. NPDC004068 TaxID=3364303 RepID=UPI0036875E30
MSNTILVTGATGTQGGAVARALLAAGFPVRALVRDPGSARGLAALGAHPVAGDLDDPASLRAAARGCRGVFSVQPSDMAAPDPETEVRRGRAVADAAAAAGVAQLVYSSVGGAERRSGVIHFETKAEIEAHIRALGIPATILRPVFFMDNWPYLLEDRDGTRVAAVALPPRTGLQMIAADDIGRVAAEVFAHPDEFLGAAIELAGDELPVHRILAALAESDRIPTRLEQPSVLPEEFARMYAWIATSGFRADIPALRRRFPKLLTFADWLRAR